MVFSRTCWPHGENWQNLPLKKLWLGAQRGSNSVCVFFASHHKNCSIYSYADYCGFGDLAGRGVSSGDSDGVSTGSSAPGISAAVARTGAAAPRSGNKDHEDEQAKKGPPTASSRRDAEEQNHRKHATSDRTEERFQRFLKCAARSRGCVHRKR